MMDSNLQNIRNNLETQLSELESLESMFCNPGELRVDDVEALTLIKEFVEKSTDEIPPNLDLIITLLIEDVKFELYVNLSYDYPNVTPKLFVRNHKLNRIQHTDINKNLNEFITAMERGEPCIFSAISWLQDNANNYLDVLVAPTGEDSNNSKNKKLVRYWIYSHHIYSKTKRREIIDLANHLKLSGFTLPGRPGIICIEGAHSDCEEWWQIIKLMNWKKIYCKIIEEDTDGLEEQFRKFQGFSEVVFRNTGVKCTHMDMGELLRYLEEHQVSYIFNEIFGLEAKSN